MFHRVRSTPNEAGADGTGRHRGARIVVAAAALAGTMLATSSIESPAFASGIWSAPTLVDSGAAPTSVSCPRVKFCVAVDSTGNAIIHKRNNTWAAPDPLDLGDGGLTSVSCANALFCIAVDGVGSERRYSYGTWFNPFSIDPGVVLDSVSCVTNTFCVAVDDSGNALVYNGTAWTAPSAIDPGNSLTSVSCPTVSFCVAVDGVGNAFTFHGTSWSSPVSADSGNAVKSVSCATPTLCAAVDDNGNALTYDGTSWTVPTNIDVAHALNSVSCAPSGLCVAVDDSGNALIYDGTSWSGASSIDSSNALESVSCPTANFCAAVDGVGNALTFPPPVAITTTSLPDAVHYHFYSTTVAATGGNPPYKWLAKLPRGLRINRTTGVISGTPRRAVDFVVTVTLLDRKIRIHGRPVTQNRASVRLMLTVS
ncbi:MAG TPA: putative Ig domain-containing protein [Acidimicrobiales bacterium]|nr:putative Ig domain-containing protein [Acidimicrobiales bacterium]